MAFSFSDFKFNLVNILMLTIVVIIIILIIINVNKVYTTPNNNNNSCNLELIETVQSYVPTQQIITNNNNLNEQKLVLYYTTWCGYSKQFFPEWQKILDSDLKNIISLVSYDCDKSNECSIDNVNGYPTVILHKNGQKIKYNGNRTADAIIEFVKQNIQ